MLSPDDKIIIVSIFRAIVFPAALSIFIGSTALYCGYIFIKLVVTSIWP